MKHSIIYLENSIFGFYYDKRPENKSKTKATKILFEQIKGGLFEAFTSPLTIRELSAAPEAIKNKLLALIEDYGIKVINVDGDELESLVKKYMNERIVPKEFEDDARHVAYAAILKVDILVSLNLEHIANEWNARKFNGVNLKEGYFAIVIRTPEEVIHYGD